MCVTRIGVIFKKVLDLVWVKSSLEISPEVTIFSKFFRFSDIPSEIYTLSEDKAFREKDIFLFN